MIKPSDAQLVYLRHLAGVGPAPARIMYPTIALCLSAGWCDRDGITEAGRKVIGQVTIRPAVETGVRLTFELYDGTKITGLVMRRTPSTVVIGYLGVELETAHIVGIDLP